MAESPFKAAVISDEAAVAETLMGAVHDVLPGADVQRVERALAAAAPEPAGALTGADLVVVATGPLIAQTVSLVESLQQRAPRPATLVCGPALGAEELLHLMRAGTDEYLPLPAPESEIGAAVRRVVARAGRLPEHELRQGRSVAVFSTTGGAGVTTVAVNLALALRSDSKRPVLLLDLSQGGGDADALLDVIPRYGVSDLLRNLHRVDESLLHSYVEHHSSGLDLLRAPTSIDAEQLSTEHITSVLRAVLPHYAWVVIDAGNVLDAATLHVLSRVDTPVHVVAPTVASLRSARRAIALLRQQASGLAGRCLTVVNGIDHDLPISVRDVASTLEVEPRCTLERDEAMRRRDAVGRGPALLHGRSRWTRELQALARSIDAAQPGAPSGEAAAPPRPGVRPSRSPRRTSVPAAPASLAVEAES